MDTGGVVERPAKDSFPSYGRRGETDESWWPLPDAVRAAFDDVVAAFADARLSAAFDACPHCFTDRDLAYLRTVPPLEMTDRDLGTIAFDFVNLIGTERDIAYFLPSVVSAQLRGVAIEEAIVFRLLRDIPSDHWTERRRDALLALYSTFFRLHPEADDGGMGEPEMRALYLELLTRRGPGAPPLAMSFPGWHE